MEALLKASEASALMGLSVRHVQRMAKSGELPYQTHMNERNRPEYLFPLSSLPDAAQQKYFAEHAPAALPAAAPAKANKAVKPAACKPLEAYTAEERGEIGYWITTVDRWQTYRNKAGTKKAECDEKFVLLCRMEEPDRQLSVETLYRKWAAIREGDYGALVDMRGKARKGMSKMPEAIERVFLSLFLDESQLPVPRCIALTEEWAQQNMPEAMPLPGYHTFYRKAKAVPYPVMVLCRMGEKKYYDLCSPYIRREDERINANDGYRSIISFVRKSPTRRNNILIVCNFTPVARPDYRVGVPKKKQYKLIMDEQGRLPKGKVFKAEKKNCDNREFSFAYPLEAYGVGIFTY